MLLWIDLETTGLDASKDKILEVAAIMTTDDLIEVGRFHAVTSEASRMALGSLKPEVQCMHLDNGLWFESARTTGDAAKDNERVVSAIDDRLAKFVASHANRTQPQLAGSTVGFDRGFLKACMPRTHEAIHYRNLDVTTLHEITRRLWPEIHCGPDGDPRHRAMNDIESSLECARKYATAIGAWRTIAIDVANPVVVIQAPVNDSDLTKRLLEMDALRSVSRPIILDSTPPAPAEDALRGLRAIAALPPSQLSKPLRTEDVAAAIAWIRGEFAEQQPVPEQPVAAPESGTP